MCVCVCACSMADCRISGNTWKESRKGKRQGVRDRGGIVYHGNSCSCFLCYTSQPSRTCIFLSSWWESPRGCTRNCHPTHIAHKSCDSELFMPHACIHTYVQDYLSQAETRQAHITPSTSLIISPAPNTGTAICSLTCTQKLFM